MLQLRDMFLKNYPHEIPWVWFDNNIKKHFAIDVYQHPFPESGHIIIKSDGVELLMMKAELDNDLKAELVGNFVGIDSFEIANANVSNEKIYAAFMDEFKRLKLPLWYLHRLSATKYMKHFYGRDIGNIIREWKEPDQSAA